MENFYCHFPFISKAIVVLLVLSNVCVGMMQCNCGDYIMVIVAREYSRE